MRLALLLTMLLLIGCTTPTGEVTQEGTVRIGAILALTDNDLAAFSVAMQEGIDLAVEEINAEGGIDGKRLEIVYEDDQLDSAKAVGAAMKLTHVDTVPIVLMSGTNTAKAAGPVFEEAKIPLLVLWDTNEDLKAMGDYTFGIGFSTEKAGYVMAEKLKSEGAQTAAIIRHQDEWSQLISASFAKRFSELGGKIVVDESLPVGVSDFRSVLLKARGVDAIYVPLVGQLDILFRQTRDSGFKGMIATGDSMSQDAIDGAKGAAEGVYFTTVFTPEGSRIKALEERYVERYGKDPEMLVFTALGYDGIMVAAEALRTGGTDPVAISDALYAIKGLQGAAGTVTIEADGFAEKLEPLFVVKDGKMEPTE
jgi:branched-chain amino acid transport system substrate-binding protein